MREFRTRLRSVKLKNGGAQVRIFHTPPKPDFRQNVRTVVEQKLAAFDEPVAAFALVILGSDLSSDAFLAVGKNCPMSGLLLPDFIRERLMAQRIEDWTMETVRKEF